MPYTDSTNQHEYTAHTEHHSKKYYKSTAPAYAKELDEQEVSFINYYFEFGLDVKKAAREAGYGAANFWTLLRRPHVAQAIYERLQYEQLAAPELMQMVASIARADVRNYLRVEEVESVDEQSGEVATTKRIVPDLASAIESGNTYAIKSIEFNRDGSVKKFVLEEKLEAIRLIGAAFGMFGLDKSHENDGLSMRERLRNLDPRIVLSQLVLVAKEFGISNEELGTIFDATKLPVVYEQPPSEHTA